MPRVNLSRWSRALLAGGAFLAPAVVGNAGLALAQPAPAAHAADSGKCDAATRYWLGFAQLQPMDDAQRAVIENWNTAPLDATARKVIDMSEGALRQMHRGSLCDHCDWGLDTDEGIMLLLPHLPKARNLARLACLRARWRFENKQDQGAIEDVVDMLILARRAGADNLNIAMLVEFAMEQMAVDTIVPHLSTMDPRTRSSLGEQIAKLPAGGNLIASVQTERQFSLEYLIRQLSGLLAKDGRPVDQSLAELGLPIEQVRAAGSSPAAIVEKLKELRPTYDQYAAALQLPPVEAHARLTELWNQAADKPLGQEMLPNYAKMYDRHHATQTRFAMLRAALAVLNDGPDQLKKFPDPSTGQSFELIQQPGGGIDLRSKFAVDNKPVTLLHPPQIGPSKPESDRR